MDEVAKKLHDQGNESFKRQDFLDAREFYTELLCYISSRSRIDLSYLATILSNRAAVYLKLGFPELAWSDSSYSLFLEGKNLKAAYRLSMCYYEMGLPKLANVLLSSHLATNKAIATAAEIDTMNALLKHCATISDDVVPTVNSSSSVTSKSLQNTNGTITSSQSELYITYRDYVWECKKKSKLSLKMIRKELFGDCDSICLQQIEGVGRGLVAKHNFRQGDVIFESKISLCTFGKLSECHACTASFLSVSSGGPIFACPKCRICFCSLECYQMAMSEYHSVLCNRSLEPLITCIESFPSNVRTCLLLLRLFAIAKHKNLHPLELPHIKYLKRIKERNTTEILSKNCDLFRYFIPTRFEEAHRITLDILGIKFDVKFDFWVYLTLHRILLLNCIPFHSFYSWLIPAMSLVNHSQMPNAIMEEVTQTAPKRIRIVAKNNIGKGDEITISYVPSNFALPERFKALLHYGIAEDPDIDFC